MTNVPKTDYMSDNVVKLVIHLKSINVKLTKIIKHTNVFRFKMAAIKILQVRISQKLEVKRKRVRIGT